MANFLVDQGVVIEQVYESLCSRTLGRTTVRWSEYQSGQLAFMFGTREGGIYSASPPTAEIYFQGTRGRDGPMTVWFSSTTFVITDDDVVELNELTLPLFREYGQLFVETLLEQINVAKQKGKDSIAAAHTKELISKIEAFREPCHERHQTDPQRSGNGMEDERIIARFQWNDSTIIQNSYPLFRLLLLIWKSDI